MSAFLFLVLAAVPILPVLAGLLARRGPAGFAGRVTTGAATGSAALAVISVACLARFGPQTARWAPWGPDAPLAIAFRLDAVSAAMICLITGLGVVILRFSRRYLAGEPRQAAFFSWMSLTLGSVLLLVLAGHLLLLFAAWVATSLCLHQLLLYYPGRAGAVFAARKKFVLSRLGDACLLAAALVLHAHYATFDLEAIFAAIAAGGTAGVGTAGFLLAACAMLKSAQFPFHSWLPDTMETPTPVSALMHAGIINGGGFLVVRLAPLFAAARVASELLAVVGALTAAFGAVVMLTQPSVKRALAYSTIAQMGFMILQCGLGAYGLALLHICAHSLYKAHAFLTSGSTIGTVPRAALPLRSSALTVGVLAGGLLVALGATTLHVLAPAAAGYPDIFDVVLALAVAYAIARAWSAQAGGWVTAGGIAVAVVVTALSFGLHAAARLLCSGWPTVRPPLPLVFALGAVFAGLFLVQSFLWRSGRHPWGRRLYVHAVNGFYVGTWFNRLLRQLWPVEPHLLASSCPLTTLPPPVRRPI